CVYTRSHRSAYSFHICPPHTCIDTLSLHDALPIFGSAPVGQPSRLRTTENAMQSENTTTRISRRITGALVLVSVPLLGLTTFARSEEHTSELQSRFDLVCRLLLEKKK